MEAPPLDLVVERAARLLPPGADDAAVGRAAALLTGRPAPAGAVARRLAELRGARARFAALLASGTGIPQRTAAWYAARERICTASELDKLLSSPDAFVAGKRRAVTARRLGAPDPFAAVSRAPAVRWGTRFEPVAAAVYAAREGVVLRDFGLMLHPELAGFGASPDGITEDGVMLEIKCPYSRVPVAGAVPKAYAAQVQGQLEVCGLEECDFLECSFALYMDAEEFAEDAHPDDPSLTAAGAEKGALLVPAGFEDALPPGAPEVTHSRVGASGAEALEWAGSARRFGAVQLWRLAGYNLVRVRRDRGFFEAARARVEAAAARLTALQTEELAPAAAAAPEEEEPASPADLPRFAFLEGTV